MKTFVATLSALLITMLIGFGFWKHEKWVEAKNECLSAIHNAYAYGLDAHGDLDTQIATLGAAQSSAAMAAERLVEVFHAKILPLSSQDRRDLNFAQKIVAEHDFGKERSRVAVLAIDAHGPEEKEKIKADLLAVYRKYGKPQSEAEADIKTLELFR